MVFKKYKEAKNKMEQNENNKEVEVESIDNHREEFNKEFNKVQDELYSIKNWAIITIVGYFFLFFPGLIFSIVLGIKMLSYKYNKNSSNNDLRIVGGVLAFFTLIIGPIISLIFVNKELSDLEERLKKYFKNKKN